MSFRYDVLNLSVLDSARLIFAKPSTQWTDQEATMATLIIEAMRVVASHAKRTKPDALRSTQDDKA